MPSNPPSLWRRLTDCGSVADKLRANLARHLELPQGEATLARVVRRDASPMQPGDWVAVAGALALVHPACPIGLISTAQCVALRDDRGLDLIEELRKWGRGVRDLGRGETEDIAGVIRLRPDGSIPARTQARTSVAAPWQVEPATLESVRWLAQQWGCSSPSAALVRLVEEGRRREERGAAKLLGAVENAGKTQAKKKSTKPHK